jgi:hypothetical protein
MFQDIQILKDAIDTETALLNVPKLTHKWIVLISLVNLVLYYRCAHGKMSNVSLLHVSTMMMP